jgi:uncharacterized metal-binding protein YceD (DUF177 family)
VTINQNSTVGPWSVPVTVAEIPETGMHVDLTADSGTRDAVAAAAGVAAMPNLQASFDLVRIGADGVRLAGRVQATVVQNCVVTLDPLENRIDEAVELVFLPEPAGPADAAGLQPIEGEEPPEVLVNGTVDLGAIAVEFVLLGIDPYPRKPGAVFEAAPAGDPSSHPFAALAALKKGENPGKA